jgi:hypothetical protein
VRVCACAAVRAYVTTNTSQHITTPPHPPGGGGELQEFGVCSYVNLYLNIINLIMPNV